MQNAKSILSIMVAAGLLVYAVPRMEVGQGWTAPTVFAVVWLGMMLLIVAAHLYRLLGVDKETRRDLEQVRKYKQYRNRRWLETKLDRTRARGE